MKTYQKNKMSVKEKVISVGYAIGSLIVIWIIYLIMFGAFDMAGGVK